jgi:competence protein ComEC
MASRPLQIGISNGWRGLGAGLETRLEAERDRIALWLPVAVGGGIALWFVLPDRRAWHGALLLLAACGVAAMLLSPTSRLAIIIRRGALAAAAGLVLVWLHAALADAPVIARPVSASFSAIVERVEPLPARAATRITVAPVNRSDLPHRLRLTLADRDQPAAPLVAGQAIGINARIMPPPGPALPGGYDFAQRAWFDGIGAVGSMIGCRSSPNWRAARGGLPPHWSPATGAASPRPTMKRCSAADLPICCRSAGSILPLLSAAQYWC